MVWKQRKSWMAGVLACGLSSVALAGTSGSTSSSQNVQAQIAALKAQVAQLQQQQGKNWLTQRRAEQVKSLIRSVLKDADTRESLLDEGMTAGWDHGFFLKSNDGRFKLSIGGQFDFRYIYNHTKSTDNQNVQGFQTRRAKFWFTGHVFGRQLTYKILGSFDRHSGNAVMEDGWVDYNFGNGFDVKAGQYTTPLFREYMISSSAQQAVARTLVTTYFGTEFTKGVTVNYKAHKFRVLGMLSGGPGTRNTDFNGQGAHSSGPYPNYEYGLIGHGDYLLAGNWKEFSDFQDWTTDPFGVMIGGGGEYDAGANGGGLHKADVVKYTADVSAKLGNGLNLFGAFEGQHISPRGDSTVITPSGSQYGFIAQVGQFIVPDHMDVFARYEYANLKGGYFNNHNNVGSTLSSNDKLSLVTVGTNYYFHKHNAKLTVDGVYALDPVSSDFNNAYGAGILTDSKKGQFVLRAQFQLKF